MKFLGSIAALMLAACLLCAFGQLPMGGVTKGGGGGSGTPSYVNGAQNGCASGSVATCAVTKSVTTGNLLIACTDGSGSQAAPTGISDTKSSSWADVASDARSTSAFLRCWYTKAGGSGSDTVTASYSPNSAFPDVWVQEFANTGTWPSVAIDQVVHTNGNSTACVPGTTAAISVSELVWAACTDDTSITFAAASGYTMRADVTTGFYTNQDKNASSGTQTISIAITTGHPWAGILATFKAQ